MSSGWAGSRRRHPAASARLVLERRAAQHREYLHRDGRLADAGFELLLGRLLAFEKQMKKHVVGVGNRLDEIVACLLRRLQQLSGNLFHRVLRAHCLVEPQNRPHRDQVDHA